MALRNVENVVVAKADERHGHQAHRARNLALGRRREQCPHQPKQRGVRRAEVAISASPSPPG